MYAICGSMLSFEKFRISKGGACNIQVNPRGMFLGKEFQEFCSGYCSSIRLTMVVFDVCNFTVHFGLVLFPKWKSPNLFSDLMTNN